MPRAMRLRLRVCCLRGRVVALAYASCFGVAFEVYEMIWAIACALLQRARGKAIGFLRGWLVIEGYLIDT